MNCSTAAISRLPGSSVSEPGLPEFLEILANPRLDDGPIRIAIRRVGGHDDLDVHLIGFWLAELFPLHRGARRIGCTSRWLRAEADAERILCLCADNRHLFNIEAVTLALSRRAACAVPDIPRNLDGTRADCGDG